MKLGNIVVFFAAVSTVCACGTRASFEKKEAAYNQVMDSLSNSVRSYVMENRDALLADDSLALAGYEALVAEITDFNRKALASNRKNPLGAKAFCTLSMLIEDQDELLALSNKLSKSAKEDESVKEIINAIDARKKTNEGEMFSDFTVSTVEGIDGDGNEIAGTASLSDYVGKGKYVLVDFWASWCGPCRREVPNIKAVYETYAGEDFDVLSIAVWDSAADSFEAIAEEGMTWSQMVLDEESKAVPTDAYGIQGIPHIILFGPDGTIVKRDLRGEAISAVVAEALGK